ncbi:MAG: PIG-L family deacetylase [Acidobacteriia bacterium]|nr:PIG-L family deacetylase [Terriglobia bacterium]
MRADDVLSVGRHLLVVVAHQDDEIACSVLLQRVREALIVFATDGAPAAEFFWSAYGSRRRYAEVRHAEALQSVGVLENAGILFLKDQETDLPFRDQELFRRLASAAQSLKTVVQQFTPDALLGPAYEGGHPDHDACSFLVNAVGRALSIPRWEMPLYHRSSNGSLVHQAFRTSGDGETLLHASQLELKRREEMLSKYASQRDLPKFVSGGVERFRPQPDYDYSQPPHPGALNYEVWGWPMNGSDLCAAFQRHGAQRRAASASGETSLA